jgi:ubiquitin carboxyl-terminal hydrolase 8
MNGSRDGVHGIGADGWRSSDGAGDSRGALGPFPPIAEIIASATETAETQRHHSVHMKGALNTAIADHS